MARLFGHELMGDGEQFAPRRKRSPRRHPVPVEQSVEAWKNVGQLQRLLQVPHAEVTSEDIDLASLAKRKKRRDWRTVRGSQDGICDDRQFPNYREKIG
jgi:hypothetical protein